ncbi:MAG TPA: hypothetical protein VG317_17600 [Pseudonocardiaceae bacterium]|jgi:hypothetical protein|nr:hypothetical protein [Pseudonocardiaceae bacterium]
MTSFTTAANPRDYALTIPTGFIRLPVSELTDNSIKIVATHLAATFHQDYVDDNMRALAFALSTAVSQTVPDAVSFVGVGLFRSPEADRPIMVVLTCLSQGSDHGDIETGIAGLLEVHRQENRGSVEEIQLPCGRAVAVVIEDLNELTVAGSAPIPLIRRSVTAWIPDPHGTTTAVISLSSNNWQDWDHVCRLALDLFGTLEWS